MDITWLLHYKVYIGISKIHGVGLRAVDNIKKGEVVFFYKNENVKKVKIQDLLNLGVSKNTIEVLCRLCYATEEYIFIKENQGIDFVNNLNHHDDSNLIFKNGYYIASKDIKKDEEVVLDWTENDYHPQLNFKPNKNEK